MLQKLCGILTKYNRKQGKQLRKQYTNINEAQIAAKIRLEVGVNDINSLSKCKCALNYEVWKAGLFQSSV